MASDRCLACAGFCGLPLVVILVFAVLYQLVNLQSFQNLITRCFPESKETIFESRIITMLRQPEQVHIALGVRKNSFKISWMTTDIASSTVKIGLSPLLETQMIFQGDAVQFREAKTRAQYVHSVTLNNLESEMFYFYVAGSDEGGWSDVFWFKTLPEDETSFSPTFAYFGDFGYVNAVSLPQLQDETHHGLLDLLIHAGDMAYDLDDDDGKVGDAFMRQIQPIAAYLPYMTTPGNHEHPDNYLEYRNRFLMPLSEETQSKGELHFSFDYGPIHFVSLNVEVYYKNGGTLQNVSSQYDWLVNDLKVANLPENRKKRPWIILFGHRAMYCSPGWWDCANPMTKTRVGVDVAGTLKYGVEELLMKYNVDLCLWAHKHNYERLWPIYNFTIYKPDSLLQSDQRVREKIIEMKNDPYFDPKAPIHVTAGTAGSKEGLVWWANTEGGPDPEFLAAKSYDYGFTRIKVHNLSHLHLEQVSIDQGGRVIDDIWITSFDHDFSKNLNI